MKKSNDNEFVSDPCFLPSLSTQQQINYLLIMSRFRPILPKPSEAVVTQQEKLTDHPQHGDIEEAVREAIRTACMDFVENFC